jgi:hypothetical protein
MSRQILHYPQSKCGVLISVTTIYHCISIIQISAHLYTGIRPSSCPLQHQPSTSDMQPPMHRNSPVSLPPVSLAPSFVRFFVAEGPAGSCDSVLGASIQLSELQNMKKHSTIYIQVVLARHGCSFLPHRMYFGAVQVAH